MTDDLNFKINLNENEVNNYGSQKSTELSVRILQLLNHFTP